ncbi:ubiquitin carboxyl-terminal hydrolase 2-like isoform X1 [Stegodyphus dumicola]|uniref:ubiquitin carboxyl-terminal hydrolase 2-like isoform X1 n=1 Tax=Stegodyphus dumicola TaxID=202533 RepID=UPI0015B33B6F|nr:ubiquitin carboxyl-terminal hydrolase 2-like isoform X1 [Stegodyphus dumicola]
MSSYNGVLMPLPSSRYSSYIPSSTKYSGSSSYSTLSSSSSYRYKPPLYSSTLSSKYRSPRTYTTYSSSSPSTISRNLSSSYLNTYIPRVSSSSYTSGILDSKDSKWSSAADTETKPSWRNTPVSLSRRSSSASLDRFSHSPERSPKSLQTYTSLLDNTQTCKRSSWSQAISDEEDKPGVGVGFVNLGNTCFMNAVLQCLCHTQPLVDYCVRGSYLSDINHRSPTRGDLMRVFADVVKKVSESKTKNAINPYQLKSEVQRYAPRFSGNSQQDAQEFLRYLLQGLHDDINRVKVSSNMTIRRDSGSGDSFRTWRKYREIDDSLIVDLFAGQLKSTLKCTICNNDSVTHDPFWDISVPIPEGGRTVSLRQCFNLFSANEYLDGANKPYCEVCKKKSRSSKKMEVSKFPKVLVIHLKRFSATCYGQKRNVMVDCPLFLGNISELAAQNCTGDGSYVLYGVVDHDGSNNSGHYTAKCRNPSTKEWYEFNDTRVTKATDIISHKAYILFYIQEGSCRL